MPLCSYNTMFVLWLIVHTLWNQLLLELSLDLFNTLQICYRDIEDVHEEVWCWKNILWHTYRVFNLAIYRQLHLVNNGWMSWFPKTAPSKWYLIVYTLWNQLLLKLSLDLFNTLKLCCRHIEDVHEKVWCSKNVFWQTYRVFNLAIYRQLHLVNNGSLSCFHTITMHWIFSTLQ